MSTYINGIGCSQHIGKGHIASTGDSLGYLLQDCKKLGYSEATMMKDHVRGKKEIDRCIPVQALDI
jgi:hypothetical protein